MNPQKKRRRHLQKANLFSRRHNKILFARRHQALNKKFTEKKPFRKTKKTGLYSHKTQNFQFCLTKPAQENIFTKNRYPRQSNACRRKSGIAGIRPAGSRGNSFPADYHAKTARRFLRIFSLKKAQARTVTTKPCGGYYFVRPFSGLKKQNNAMILRFSAARQSNDVYRAGARLFQGFRACASRCRSRCDIVYK